MKNQSALLAGQMDTTNIHDGVVYVFSTTTNSKIVLIIVLAIVGRLNSAMPSLDSSSHLQKSLMVVPD